jgi:hypothetical protein
MENYWPGFELVAYAIYDKSKVYLFNHPKFSNNPSCTYHILKWDTEFTADTIIMYEEYPTAIVNMDHYKEYEDLFSMIVHELFHGYQYIKDEKRFPDEMMGITYPLSKENVELRNQERANLYCAMLENNLLVLEVVVIAPGCVCVCYWRSFHQAGWKVFLIEKIHYMTY